jgi:hypothetical protein
MSEFLAHFFEEIELENVKYRKCKHCSDRTFSFNTSKTTLERHVSHNHPDQYQQFQSVISKEEARKDIVKFIITSNSPFVLVENEYLKNIMRRLEINYGTISRQFISNEIDKIYTMIHQKMKEEIKGQDICLIIDGWSYKNKFHEIGIVGRFINDEYQPVERLLSIKTIPQRCTSQTISNIIEKLREEFNFSTSYFLSDGGSNVRKACSTFGVCFYCFAHLVSLCIGDALHHTDFIHDFNRYRMIVQHFRCSHIARDLLEKSTQKKELKYDCSLEPKEENMKEKKKLLKKEVILKILQIYLAVYQLKMSLTFFHPIHKLDGSLLDNFLRELMKIINT